MTTDKVLGALYYSRKDLEEVVAKGKVLDIKVIGMLAFADDVDEDLVRKSIRSLKVLGVLRASKEVRKALDRIK